MKSLILSITTLIFSLIAFGASSGQTSADLGLVLRGRLSEGKATHTKGQVLWSGKLLMEFENTGSTPIILIDPRLSFGTGLSKLEFYFSPIDAARGPVSDKLGFTKIIRPNLSQSGNLRSIASLFDTEKPPDNLTVILEPRASLPFEDNLEIIQKYSLIKNAYGDNGHSWEGSAGWFRDASGDYINQIGLALGEARYVRLTYEFSVDSYTDSSGLLDTISARWKKYGWIPMNQSGVYQIVAEPLLFGRGFEKVGWPESPGGFKPAFPSYRF